VVGRWPPAGRCFGVFGAFGGIVVARPLVDEYNVSDRWSEGLVVLNARIREEIFFQVLACLISVWAKEGTEERRKGEGG
jgi:hypothetical protein